MTTLIASARRLKAAYAKYPYLFRAFGLSAVGFTVFMFLAISTGSAIHLITALAILLLAAVNAVYYIIFFRREAKLIREIKELYPEATINL